MGPDNVFHTQVTIKQELGQKASEDSGKMEHGSQSADWESYPSAAAVLSDRLKEPLWKKVEERAPHRRPKVMTELEMECKACHMTNT